MVFIRDYQPKPLLIDQPDWVKEQRYLPADAACHYYWQGTLHDFTGNSVNIPPQAVQQLIRHDQPLSRVRWQFQPRQENLWLEMQPESTETDREMM